MTPATSVSLPSPATAPPAAHDAAAALLACLAASATDAYLGEDVSQLEHALQAAAAARDTGATDALVLAALFHDVGHLVGAHAPSSAARLLAARLPASPPAAAMGDYGAAAHESAGADVLRAWGCGDDVTRPVRAHVDAKRYLCWRVPGYHEQLSAASRITLAHQGGAMDAAEASRFAKRDDLRAVLCVRVWDERAKVRGARVPPLDTYRDLLVSHLLETAAR
jgi:predicted HD phosphohydrolase